jgi:hypothetical protein
MFFIPVELVLMEVTPVAVVVVVLAQQKMVVLVPELRGEQVAHY